MTNIHPTAVVDKSAELHPSVTVGPYSIVGPHVKLEEGVTVGPHAVITGHTTLGKNVKVFQFASVGENPQDLKFKNEPTKLFVGENTVIREYVSLHVGTATGRAETRIGAKCLLMTSVHVAHDCIVGDEVIIASGTALAGHVTVGNQAIISGLVGVHQFTRLGRNCFISGGSAIVEDVIPFAYAQGDRARLRGLNVEGLKRRGYSPERIASIKGAYKTLFREKRTLEDALQQLEKTANTQDAKDILEFCKTHKRAIMRP